MKRLLMISLIAILLLSACGAPAVQTSPSLYGHDLFDPDQESALNYARDYDDLLALYADSQQNSRMIKRDPNKMEDFEGMSPSGPTANGADNGVNQNYSTTNIQVEGVDEADIIKTDGAYLYVIANNRLYIVDAQVPAAMTLLSTQVFGNSNEQPVTMFLDVENQRLTLISSGWSEQAISKVSFMAMPSGKSFTSTRVYDISDKSDPALVRQFTQTGYFLDARKIDSNVYVITNEYKYPVYSVAADGSINTKDLKPEEIFPATSSDFGTIKSFDLETLPADQIAILPQGDVNNQLVIAGIDSLNDNIDPNVLGVLGTSGTVYCSPEYLYIASYNYPWLMMAVDDVMASAEPTDNQVVTTDIYRFKLDDTKISEAGQGSVPGYILNQFSMDEYDGYFRIATTIGESWAASEAGVSMNNVYILNQELEIVGQVTALAPGETIKSVRFMGDKAYVVTFKNVDPLFVVDLTDPAAPVVLGQLKIPGYSTYLHPYADNMLLGFGYDVMTQDGSAFNGGIKVSLFDISDFSNPQELSSIVLGGRGSYSELLYNHKALLFSRENNLIAFPATLTKEVSSIYEYSRFDSQGLVILSVSASNKLVLRKLISHIDSTTIISEGEYFGPDVIFRGAYIDKIIFTFSNKQIMATNNINFLSIGSVELPGYVDNTVVTPEIVPPVDPTATGEGSVDGSTGVATETVILPAA